MVREFKKIGVAAAVAGALLGSSASYATVQLSEPGDIVLVPYVVCDPAASGGQINTLIGMITFDKARLGLKDANSRYYPAPWSLATWVAGGTVPATPGSATLPIRKTGQGNYDHTVHWYFYDVNSKHLLDGVIPATDNDFVRFDWCSTIKQTGQTALNGVNGYMIFTSDDVDRGVEIPTVALYGHAYQIQGNWASQAFIPVLPNPMVSIDTNGSFSQVNVVKRDGYPAITRLLSGSDFTHLGNNVPGQRDVYMRYFLDPALATENRMVFWFNWNSGSYNEAQSAALGYTGTSSISQRRENTAGETYDSEQVYKNSFSLDLSKELNIKISTPTAPAFPGMLHSETEAYSGKTVVNSGVIRFGVPEAIGISKSTGNNSNIPFASSGVSFNMLGLGVGSNAAQLQTEMATHGPAY